MESGTEYSESLKRASGFLFSNDLEKAIDETNKALAAEPENPEAICLLGIVAFQMDDAGRALTLIERAHQLDPDCRDYADALAVINTRVGKLSEGLYYAKLATALRPNEDLTALIPWAFRDYMRVLQNPGISPHFINAWVMFHQRDYKKAAEYCEKELRVDEENGACQRLLGRALAARGEYGQALAAFQAAIALDPGDGAAHEYAGHALIHLGRFDDGRACHERAVSLAPGDVDLHSRTTAALAYFPEAEWRAFPREARALGEKILAKADRVDLSGREAFSGGRRIRIGYLSDAFCDDPRLPFIEAVLKSHDKRRFEVYCYHLTIFEDLYTIGLKGYASHWQHFQDVDDDTAARIMAGDNLDIVIDLCGYDNDQRLVVLARKPAPVQVSWLSWPHASRLGAIDYVICDPVTRGADDAHAAGETCMELESGLVAFEAKTITLDGGRSRSSPAKKNGFVTFGGVCDLARLNPSVAGLWSKVLCAVPESRLLLGGVQTICAETRTRVRELFADSGVLERVSFHVLPEDEMADPTYFVQVDVMLDTFPVSAAADTCRSLMAGIPVLTLAGTRRSALVSASILRSAGKEEWVARSDEAFVKNAAALAGDVPRLAKIRRTLRGEVAKSDLCDCAAFTRALEGAYVRMLAGNFAKPKEKKKERVRKKGQPGTRVPANTEASP